jgi:chromosome segregation ATPase
MQKELEDEMQVMRAFEESLQANIAKLNRDIENNQQTIRQKESVISDLHADIAALHRDHATALARKEDTIQMGRREVDRLNHQIDIDAEKYNTNLEKVKLAMANLEADLQAKISGLNATVSELGGELKAERETSRQQTARISELESANARLTKQKQ